MDVPNIEGPTENTPFTVICTHWLQIIQTFSTYLNLIRFRRPS